MVVVEHFALLRHLRRHKPAPRISIIFMVFYDFFSILPILGKATMVVRHPPQRGAGGDLPRIG